MWACPHCRLELKAGVDGSCLACNNGHAFDRARQGYVNLLPSNRKGSREPGDNAEMVAARRRVHDADTYHPLADAVVEELVGADVAGVVMDLGCGEGYYTGALVRGLVDASICGVDISRAAVRLAAKKCPTADFAVASTFDLPVPDGSLAATVRVFAPCDDGELVRTLAPGGYYLEVSPGPRHLWQLRQRLYDTPREHVQARAIIAGMTAVHHREVSYHINPGPGQLADIVSMTPFAHRGRRAGRESLLSSDLAAITMAFSLRLFTRDS